MSDERFTKVLWRDCRPARPKQRSTAFAVRHFDGGTVRRVVGRANLRGDGRVWFGKAQVAARAVRVEVAKRDTLT